MYFSLCVKKLKTHVGSYGERWTSFRTKNSGCWVDLALCGKLETHVWNRIWISIIILFHPKPPPTCSAKRSLLSYGFTWVFNFSSKARSTLHRFVCGTHPPCIHVHTPYIHVLFYIIHWFFINPLQYLLFIAVVGINCTCRADFLGEMCI